MTIHLGPGVSVRARDLAREVVNRQRERHGLPPLGRYEHVDASARRFPMLSAVGEGRWKFWIPECDR